MMILLSVLFSLDSFLASFLLGTSYLERSRQIKLAVAFGICDGLASIARGTGAPPAGILSWLASRQFHWTVCAYLLAVFLVWRFESGSRQRSWWLWTVPVLLSVDNLVGPGVEPFSLGSVILLASASVLLSLVGFRLGAFIPEIAKNFTRQSTVSQETTT